MIPYSRQDIHDEDIQAVVEVLRSDTITGGKAITDFEHAVAAYCNVPHALAVASGTAALHSAYAALGLEKGKTLWTSPNSFAASSNAALYLNASVDFVDVDPATGNMSMEALEAKLAECDYVPDIVTPVHFGGRAMDMPLLWQLAHKHGFKVVEDAAHALGASYPNGKKVGCGDYSHATIFSFHPVKPITTGEGGMVVTQHQDIADKVAMLRTHGITREASQLQEQPDIEWGPWYYQMQLLGYHYRITDIQAALGASQMKRLDDFIAKRRNFAKRYATLLGDLPIDLPPADETSGWHLYPIQCQNPADRKPLFETLLKEEIRPQVHYIPIHQHPYYQWLGFKKGDFPNAESYYTKEISLPLFPSMRQDEQDKVARVIQEFFSA